MLQDDRAARAAGEGEEVKRLRQRLGELEREGEEERRRRREAQEEIDSLRRAVQEQEREKQGGGARFFAGWAPDRFFWV